MAQSSDELIKREIIDFTGPLLDGCRLRIFPEGSNDDQRLVSDGGLTFSSNGISYGSCDAGWFYQEGGIWLPYIGLEGTDALNRGSSGNAQYQRFHHALGAVKEGVIGVYYLRPGSSMIQPDLYGMAVNASRSERGDYLIINDLNIVKNLIKFRTQKAQLKVYINEYIDIMESIYLESFDKRYKNDWEIFAKKRSTIIGADFVVKHAARMVRSFTDGSQRSGHIAVGEMFLTKYFFPGKTVYYLFPKMTISDLEYLDRHKGRDKEWFLLRNEPGVKIVPLDGLIGVPSEVVDILMSIKDEPSKGEANSFYIHCSQIIMDGIRQGEIRIK